MSNLRTYWSASLAQEPWRRGRHVRALVARCATLYRARWTTSRVWLWQGAAHRLGKLWRAVVCHTLKEAPWTTKPREHGAAVGDWRGDALLPRVVCSVVAGLCSAPDLSWPSCQTCSPGTRECPPPRSWWGPSRLLSPPWFFMVRPWVYIFWTCLAFTVGSLEQQLVGSWGVLDLLQDCNNLFQIVWVEA
jgi:hypothetical protein